MQSLSKEMCLCNYFGANENTLLFRPDAIVGCQLTCLPVEFSKTRLSLSSKLCQFAIWQLVQIVVKEPFKCAFSKLHFSP